MTHTVKISILVLLNVLLLSFYLLQQEDSVDQKETSRIVSNNMTALMKVMVTGLKGVSIKKTTYEQFSAYADLAWIEYEKLTSIRQKVNKIISLDSLINGLNHDLYYSNWDWADVKPVVVEYPKYYVLKFVLPLDSSFQRKTHFEVGGKRYHGNDVLIPKRRIRCNGEFIRFYKNDGIFQDFRLVSEILVKC